MNGIDPKLSRQLDKLVALLTSPRPAKRYEACEYLRIVPALTPAALSALQATLQDPDPSVAQAARRALQVHLTPDPVASQMNMDPQLAPLVLIGRVNWPAIFSFVVGLLGIIPVVLLIKLPSFFPESTNLLFDPGYQSARGQLFGSSILIGTTSIILGSVSLSILRKTQQKGACLASLGIVFGILSLGWVIAILGILIIASP